MASSCSGEVQKRDMVVVQEEEAHPYAFHVSGPRNVASPNRRDLISSSWHTDYRMMRQNYMESTKSKSPFANDLWL